MNRQAQAIIMLMFGGAILRATLTDMYLRYVKEGLRPFLIAAGAVLVAAAVMTLWYDLRPRPRAENHDHGHNHGHGEPRVGWLLLLPVLGILLIAPPPLGAFAAGQAGTALSAQNQNSDYPPLPAGDPAELSLFDYASRAVFDDGKTLTGRTVTLTGFITTTPGSQVTLTRIMLSCCAADGRPIKVGLSGNTPTATPDTWITATGTYQPHRDTDPVNGGTVPYLEVKDWQQIQEPTEPYE